MSDACLKLTMALVSLRQQQLFALVTQYWLFLGTYLSDFFWFW